MSAAVFSVVAPLCRLSQQAGGDQKDSAGTLDWGSGSGSHILPCFGRAGSVGIFILIMLPVGDSLFVTFLFRACVAHFLCSFRALFDVGEGEGDLAWGIGVGDSPCSFSAPPRRAWWTAFSCHFGPLSDPPEKSRARCS